MARFSSLLKQLPQIKMRLFAVNCINRICLLFLDNLLIKKVLIKKQEIL